MTFASRNEAGEQLGRRLQQQKVAADLVLGLPRGGVVVAAAVARALGCPLDVIVVRKIGHPRHREFAVGALAEDGTVVLDEASLDNTGVNRAELDEVIAEESQRLMDYRGKFHRAGLPALKGRRVLIVDDGLATGATMDVAVRAAKNQGALQAVVAVPVASDSGVDRLRRAADDVIALLVDPGFMAVGQYYVRFDQTSDEEVVQLLDAARARADSPSSS